VDSEVQLREFIKKHLNAALEEDKAQAKVYLPGKDKLDPMLRERIENGVYFQQVGLVRRMLEREFGGKWHNYHKKMADQSKGK
jgi:hypothetical protein